jgi:glycosyltransferase involved in cell wall biosynthesis
MRIGIVASPFIAVPPARYGGTELFVAHLARGLHSRGHDVTVYANGDSCVGCRLKWRYRHAEWPPADAAAAQLKNADHTAWAIHDAAESIDVLHLNDITGVPLTRFVGAPTVLTLHHPHETALSGLYARYPEIDYVAISEYQAHVERMPKVHVVHHGIPLEQYPFRQQKGDYVLFLGRMAPCKGVHLAIDAAVRAGIPLKLAGEIQPVFQNYWDDQVKPRIDGECVEYVGEADHPLKCELLGRARALLFPIQWNEPFGLVMIEAMACGTPVLAFSGGAVEEVVADGTSGWICADAVDMAARIVAPGIAAASCRQWATERFSAGRMVDDYIDIYESVVSGVSTDATADVKASSWTI